MLNPITYTENVVGDFLRYQLTTYPFADRALHDQMRRLLNLEETRASPLLKGPHISLSRSFRRGASLADLTTEGIIHPHLPNLVSHLSLYGHQETAIRAITAGRTTVISTGTGSGKTECFLYPIISRCLKLRDQGVPAGIVAVLVYPMNALAEDQLGRLRDLLTGTGVTFGMYIGKTPGRQPQTLLTNVKQLELLLTRHQDVELFDNARLDFLVFDEAHTFSGAAGAETACLIRRLRTYCGREPASGVDRRDCRTAGRGCLAALTQAALGPGPDAAPG
jgi:ATP-dependent helicase YprA (DUF1998 family)